MKKINKILVIAVFFFLLVIIFELVYYNYFLGNTLTPSNLETLIKKDETKDISKIDLPVTINSPADIENSSINMDTLASWMTILRWFKKGVLISSQISNKYEGKIIDIDKHLNCH